MDKKIITALVLLGLFATMSVGIFINEDIGFGEKETQSINTQQPDVLSLRVIDYSDGSSYIVEEVDS